MRRASALLAIFAFALAASTLTACCEDGTCIKAPPCKPCEQPGGGK